MASSNPKMAHFIVMMFHSRTLAHIHHLKTKSYAKHVALQGYYDGIIDLVDGIAESYQGEHGIIAAYPTDYSYTEDPVKDLEMCKDWIEKNRKTICDTSSIQNQIDTVVELLQSTLYKLKNLS